jgi:hypothetical protein
MKQIIEGISNFCISEDASFDFTVCIEATNNFYTEVINVSDFQSTIIN